MRTAESGDGIHKNAAARNNGTKTHRSHKEIRRNTNRKNTSQHETAGAEAATQGTHNMYTASRTQFNVFAGCGYKCTYCEPSFQRQAKRQKNRCRPCYDFAPHEHPERLEKKLPRTAFGEFIFTCASGDVAFCKTAYLEQIAERMRSDPTRTFLLQSKNPATFGRVKWPDNVVLGTTIETNRDELCRAISKAPPPSQRFRDLMAIDHRTKMVTIEPVMAFDIAVMVDWMAKLTPCLIWLGFDTKGCGLPEPTIEELRELHWQLSLLGIPVRLKDTRTATR